jgi:AbrB family looped-hinge helix DNA binding protein
MSTLATTRMSSKGQVVIPETIRKTLHLQAGSQFLVLGEDDVVILKSITAPSPKEFDRMVGKARKQARKAGLKRTDIAACVAKVRKNK